jgi:hypothetical protein
MKVPLRSSIILVILSLFVSHALPAATQDSSTTPESRPEVANTDESSGAAPTQSSAASSNATIPGPMRSFLRMAGISQKVSRDEVLPLLARNVELRGYNGSPDRAGRPTEYLILLERYVNQARELQALAGSANVIRVTNCSQAQPLLVVLGYRFRQTCGEHTTLETADPQRAFLTIDSGFPLSELEDKLQTGKPFTYPYHSSAVPVLFSQSDWTANDKFEKAGGPPDAIESILHNRPMARLYSALARVDEETRLALLQSPGLRKLLPLAPALDFYGGDICIRSGRVVVPGGAPADSAWKDLVGVGPESSGEFVLKLLGKDEGWLAAYFDTLSRVSPGQQAYFIAPHRLDRLYQSLRGKDLNPSPTRPVFRPDPGLLLLVTRLQFDPDGEPHVPGNLDAWKEIFQHKSDSGLVTEWGKRAKHWTGADQLIEGLVGVSRAQEGTGPLQVYLMLSEMDRGRSVEQRLTPPTVLLLADNFSRFSDQYPAFSEFHELNNESIVRYVDTAKNLDHISNAALRANAVGIFQASAGLWQILARQGQIADLNSSWQGFIKPFTVITSPNQLLDAGQASLQGLWREVSGQANLAQDEIIETLAGPNQSSPDGKRVRHELAGRIRAVLSGQRLISLDTLFTLADGLNQMAQGKPVGNNLLPLAGELREFELPRPMFTSGERSEWAPGVPINHHTGLQARTDLAKIIKQPASPKELLEARGRLTSFLRDTLVGLNYAYYEPPGAQMLHSNPLFVRSHDFSGQMTEGGGQSWQVPYVFGTGLPAAGGAHLAGSLADLPFVLARVEQDFIVPENVQALIWEELVPSLLSSAVLPRWWGISREELHAVALYQQGGEELLEKAATDESVRQTVVAILSDRMAPERLGRMQHALAGGHGKDAISQVIPADTFYLTAEFRRRFPGKNEAWGSLGNELQELSQSHPADTNWERLSKDFGAPHPALTQNYARELLNVKPFPALMGYGSRLLAESWDSNNLYWARLADERGYPPEMLNRLVPELTRRMVEKIFATDFEDWPAISRAMREAGEEFRQGKIAPVRQNALNQGP